MWVFEMDICHIYFKVYRYIYRICSNITWGKYDYGTILQLIIQLIYFKVCMFIYRAIRKIKWSKYKYGTIVQLR
jgi:hypothetical protein